MKTNNFIIAVITAFLLALSTNGNAQNRIIGGGAQPFCRNIILYLVISLI